MADYRAVLPRDAELRALPAAVADMAKFTNYTQVLGNTAPPYAQMQQALGRIDEYLVETRSAVAR